MYSKWPEDRIMSTTSATKMLDVLREWFSVHGIPEHPVTDNGPQFTAEEFDIFTKRNDIKHVKSAPYHPASNGLAERFIQSLKQSLKASQHDDRSLIQRLSTYLLTYRTTAHATTGVPPCKLLLQRDLWTRLTLLQPDCGRSVLDKQSQQKVAHDRSPGTILEVLGPVLYTVETEEGKRWKRHTHQIKGWIAPVPGGPTGVDVETSVEVGTPPFPEILTAVRPPGVPSASSPPEPDEAARDISSSEDRATVPSDSGTVTARRYPLRGDRNPHPRYK